VVLGVVEEMRMPAPLLCGPVVQLLPKAQFVHDRFHVIANLGTDTDEMGRCEWRAASADVRQVIRDPRYLLAMARENLEENGHR
jgi:hypothetical protein